MKETAGFRRLSAAALPMDLVYFAIVVSVLIFVHELGHFVWAKLFGVKVLMFSIGFGPKIVRLRGRETEYCIGILPLGGFVKMLEENRQEPVLPEDQGRTFEAQAVYKRAIIVLAGPAMSILFPVLLYLSVFASESEFSPPTIGVVLPHHAAAGKLEPGDRVLEIEGEHISTFAELRRTVRKNPGRPLDLLVFRNNQHITVTITPDETTAKRGLGVEDRVGSLGVRPHRYASVIGITDHNSPAYLAGLRTHDLVTEVRGQPVSTFADLVRVIGQNRGETVPVTYLRPYQVPNALGELSDLYVYQSGLAALAPHAKGSSMLERTGMELSDLYIADVDPGSAEHAAGMKPGDRLLSIDDETLTSFWIYLERMQQEPHKPHRVRWLTDGQVVSANIQLGDPGGSTRPEWVPSTARVGARNFAPTIIQRSVGRPSLLGYALPRALDETRDVIRFIVVGITKIAAGEISLSTIGGPISVYDVVVQERQKGASYLLWAMAVISINLGLINLLPIPALDGGHLVFLGIEAVLRHPISLRVREVASLAGLLALMILMGMAVTNDIQKRWEIIAAHARQLVG